MYNFTAEPQARVALDVNTFHLPFVDADVPHAK